MVFDLQDRVGRVMYGGLVEANGGSATCTMPKKVLSATDWGSRGGLPVAFSVPSHLQHSRVYEEIHPGMVSGTTTRRRPPPHHPPPPPPPLPPPNNPPSSDSLPSTGDSPDPNCNDCCRESGYGTDRRPAAWDSPPFPSIQSHNRPSGHAKNLTIYGQPQGSQHSMTYV